MLWWWPPQADFKVNSGKSPLCVVGNFARLITMQSKCWRQCSAEHIIGNCILALGDHMGRLCEIIISTICIKSSIIRYKDTGSRLHSLVDVNQTNRSLEDRLKCCSIAKKWENSVQKKLLSWLGKILYHQDAVFHSGQDCLFVFFSAATTRSKERKST